MLIFYKCQCGIYFTSSSPLTGLDASSISKGSWLADWLTTHNSSICNSTSCCEHDSILEGVLVTLPLMSTIDSLLILQIKINE